MPWELRVSQVEVAAATEGAQSWAAVLRALGYTYHGKNIAMIRKWADRWGIPTDHLSDRRGTQSHRRTYTEQDLRAAVAASYSWAETLRRLGYCPTGGNWKTLKKRVATFGISTAHFDPYRATRGKGRLRRTPLGEILVEGSTFSRSVLKERLFEAELKQRECELCDQKEIWNGRRISLILDHINGIRDDNRLENLRIICPNCAAGLDTHCGRKNRLEVEPRACLLCGKLFRPKYASHRYCSPACGSRQRRVPAVPRPAQRLVERPPHERLRREIRDLGYAATGRKYGVSDNAVRKWIRQYERELALTEGRDPDVVEIPTRTWPNKRRKAA